MPHQGHRKNSDEETGAAPSGPGENRQAGMGRSWDSQPGFLTWTPSSRPRGLLPHQV